MKRFFIIGDSWAIGEFRYGNKTITAVPDTGIEHYLKALGHEVVSIAQAGASNYAQLKLAHKHLTTDFDYIIWFQTETTRDIVDTHYPPIDIFNFVQCMRYIKQQNYAMAQELYEEFKVPFIVVGCLSALDPSIDDYSFAKVKVTSWLDELSGAKYELPENMHQDIMYKVLEHYTVVNKAFMVEELDRMKFVEARLEVHHNFTDGVHPKRECSEALANRLLSGLE